MPELPEVETIRRGLAKNIIGKKIAGFDCDSPKMINRPLAEYKKTLIGRQIKAVERRAKMIIFDLSGDWRLFFHLKLTGQLVFSGPTRFTHATFLFSDKSHLYFNDIRKFGWVRLYRSRELEEKLEEMKLGPEPLNDDFTPAVFKTILKKKPNNKIKVFLMDPQNIVGIGNIYSDEICFFARVRPDRPVKTLTEKEITLLFKGIKKILNEAVKYEGTSVSDYVNALGEAGAYTKKLRVYRRYGQKCYLCKGVVRRLKLGGRTSSFCPNCQK